MADDETDMEVDSTAGVPFDPGEGLRRAIREALEKARVLAVELEKRSGPPRPADLYFLPGQSDEVVQWAVILDHPERPGVVYVVPADNFPLAGTPDVEAAESPTHGPLTLRCGLGFWAGADFFEGATRSGVLSRAPHEEARATLLEMATGTLDGTPLASEIDDDPEYEDHIESLAALVEKVASRPPRLIPFVAKRRVIPRPLALAIAAGFLLAAATGLYFASTRNGGEAGNGPLAQGNGPVEAEPTASRWLGKLPSGVDLECEASAGSRSIPPDPVGPAEGPERTFAVPDNQFQLMIRPPLDGVAVVVKSLPGLWQTYKKDRPVKAAPKDATGRIAENVYNALTTPADPATYYVVVTDPSSTPVGPSIESLGAPESGDKAAIERWKEKVASALKEAGHRWYSIEEIRTRPATPNPSR